MIEKVTAVEHTTLKASKSNCAEEEFVEGTEHSIEKSYASEPVDYSEVPASRAQQQRQVNGEPVIWDNFSDLNNTNEIEDADEEDLYSDDFDDFEDDGEKVKAKADKQRSDEFDDFEDFQNPHQEQEEIFNSKNSSNERHKRWEKDLFDEPMIIESSLNDSKSKNATLDIDLGLLEQPQEKHKLKKAPIVPPLNLKQAGIQPARDSKAVLEMIERTIDQFLLQHAEDVTIEEGNNMFASESGSDDYYDDLDLDEIDEHLNQNRVNYER